MRPSLAQVNNWLEDIEYRLKLLEKARANGIMTVKTEEEIEQAYHLLRAATDREMKEIDFLVQGHDPAHGIYTIDLKELLTEWTWSGEYD